MSKLERIVHDDSNGLDYILVGEIYLPLIAVPEEKRDIGFYGSLHRNYLKDYKSGLYSYLTLTGKLWTYLADLNEQCVERRDLNINSEEFGKYPANKTQTIQEQKNQGRRPHVSLKTLFVDANNLEPDIIFDIRRCKAYNRVSEYYQRLIGK